MVLLKLVLTRWTTMRSRWGRLVRIRSSSSVVAKTLSPAMWVGVVLTDKVERVCPERSQLEAPSVSYTVCIPMASGSTSCPEQVWYV